MLSKFYTGTVLYNSPTLPTAGTLTAKRTIYSIQSAYTPSIVLSIIRCSLETFISKMEFQNRFIFSKAGIALSTITGSLSCLSSFFIATFILRSTQNTTYHRILFILSSADICSSFAIALTTLPMPKDGIYPFASPSYGTTGTCEAQGLVFVIGSALQFCMNITLNIYYLCVIHFEMDDAKFKRLIEPILYFSSIIASTILPIVFLLKKNMLNPTPVDTFCGPRMYPDGCKIEDNPACRGDIGSMKLFFVGFNLCFWTGLGVLVVTMCTIIFTFVKRERMAKIEFSTPQEVIMGSPTTMMSTKTEVLALGDDDKDILDYKMHELKHARKTKVTIITQSLMYIGAFLIAWLVTGLMSVNPLVEDLYWAQVLKIGFQPLQGFFNALIFFYHKLYTFRLFVDGDATATEVLWFFITNPKKVPTGRNMISNLDIILSDDAVKKMRNIQSQQQTHSPKQHDECHQVNNYEVISSCHNVVFGENCDSEQEERAYSNIAYVGGHEPNNVFASEQGKVEMAHDTA